MSLIFVFNFIVRVVEQLARNRAFSGKSRKISRFEIRVERDLEKFRDSSRTSSRKISRFEIRVGRALEKLRDSRFLAKKCQTFIMKFLKI